MYRVPRYILVVTNAALVLVALLLSIVTSQSSQAADNLQIIQPVTPTPTPRPINIGNFVWDDLDQDGVQDAGEPGISGVTVQLWNSGKTLLIATTTTNSSGIYTLTAPGPGQYRVRVVLPSQADQFSPKDATTDTQDSDINPSGINAGFTDVYSLAANVISITNIDAGIIPYIEPTPTRTPTPINLGNFVWDDLNANGIQDAGEPGKGEVTVQLWNSSKTSLIASTVTNSNGNYTLVAPTPGDYRIRVVLNAVGDQFSPKDATTDTQDSDINPSGIDAGFTDVFTIASNVIAISNLDAGIISSGSPTFTPMPSNTPTATPTNTPTPTSTPAPTLELIAPTGTITDSYGAPVYEWYDISGATSYEIWVGRENSAQVIYETVSDAIFCNGAVCQFNAVNISNNYWLANGMYQVWLREQTINGFQEWAGPFWFTIEEPAPPIISGFTVTNPDSANPTFSWNEGANAAWYEIWVGTVAPGWATQFTGWFSYIQLDCNLAGICSITPELNLPGGSYIWYVRSWGPGGFNEGGIGTSWVEGTPFNTSDISPPPPVTIFNVSDQDSGTPTFSWGATENSTWYEIWVGTGGPNWTTHYNNWHSDAQLGCHNAGTCTITPEITLPGGSYIWYVRSWGPGGFNTGGLGGGWAEGPSFNVP